jgi:hypothetical protein
VKERKKKIICERKKQKEEKNHFIFCNVSLAFVVGIKWVHYLP